ncbi:hypothetical protein BDZ91DRAFT_763440 [Kalaharituber pfeilii]|nr:hypothetical protein BDZ91DRAFT_763440 [Kalaharituber pfeilii]
MPFRDLDEEGVHISRVFNFMNEESFTLSTFVESLPLELQFRDRQSSLGLPWFSSGLRCGASTITGEWLRSEADKHVHYNVDAILNRLADEIPPDASHPFKFPAATINRLTVDEWKEGWDTSKKRPNYVPSFRFNKMGDRATLPAHGPRSSRNSAWATPAFPGS